MICPGGILGTIAKAGSKSNMDPGQHHVSVPLHIYAIIADARRGFNDDIMDPDSPGLRTELDLSQLLRGIAKFSGRSLALCMSMPLPPMCL